ncbi:glycosyl hydrolase family 28 protein [Serratia aquatilis]|uniref:Glycosyl hydrolase family 28 protein n=1 Tax=Serratia aquatilis TaxID=1737515 RepID=A0ABV6EG36_9GAMM
MFYSLPKPSLTLGAVVVLSGLLMGCDNASNSDNVSNNSNSSNSNNSPNNNNGSDNNNTPDNNNTSGGGDNNVVDRSKAPQKVQVPTLAFDEGSVVLVWEKPEQYSDIKDYNVYVNGQLIGSANANHDLHSPAKPYIDNFYQHIDSEDWHTKIGLHNFTVTGLTPATEYSFTVRAVYADGKESVDSETVKQQTTAKPYLIDVKDFGAKGDGATLDTAAIQSAIDACTLERYSQGCKVQLTEGIYKSGALFLHSNMTFEVAENAVLLGSADAADYPLEKGYTLYPYTSPAPLPKRPPSLLNVLEAKDQGSTHAGTFENIRIVGKGTIDGNGWTRGISAGGVDEIADEVGNKLPQYRASKEDKVHNDGILAKSQVAVAVDEGMSLTEAYKNRRSSLMTLRGIRNLYVDGLTILNPAFHGVMVLESENVVMNALSHTTFDANNADGIEFGNSQNVMVFNNFFDTGDDCVNFAAGFGAGVQEFSQKAQSGAWIFNNYFRNGHGAVVAGSHTGAWIEKIRAEDNVMYLTFVGLRMKSRPYYGGGARDVLFRDNAMVAINEQPFVFTIKYAADVNDTVPASEPAQFRDVTVKNVTIDGTSKKNSILVDGMTVAEMESAYGFAFERDAFHRGLHFENVKFKNTKATDISFLRDSQFNQVVFENVPAAWKFMQAQAIILKDSANDDVVNVSGDEVITLEAATE